MNFKHSYLATVFVVAAFYACTSTKQKKDEGAKTPTISTLFISGDSLIEKEIPYQYIFSDGLLKNKYIKSIEYQLLEDVLVEGGYPPKIEFKGIPLVLNFENEAVYQRGTPEYTAMFFAFHITHCIEFYNKLFANKLNFNTQKNYLDVRILQGNAAYLSTPNSYVINPGIPLNPTQIYHQVGLRAMQLIKDDLGIDLLDSNRIVSYGLIEYFNASLSDYPIIMQHTFPKNLERNISKKLHYPEDLVFMNTTLPILRDSFAKTQANRWHFDYYNSYAGSGIDLSELMDLHKSASLIAHPLWKIREAIGASASDKIIAETILDFNETIGNHKYYNAKEQLNWQNLLHGLLKKDEDLNGGKNRALIINAFKETGFELSLADS